MKRRQGSVAIIVIIVTVLVVIAGVVYYTLQPKTTPVVSTSVSPAASTSSSTGTKIAKTNLELVLPVGWKEVTVTNYPGDETVRIESTSGDWLQVDVNAGGRDVAADVFWEYSVQTDGAIQLVKENADSVCTPSDEEPFCVSGDGKLDLYVGLKPDTYKGKTYSIFAGNTKTEKADRQVFRDILKSMKLK